MLYQRLSSHPDQKLRLLSAVSLLYSSGELGTGNTPHLYLNIVILKLGRKTIYDFRNLISLNLCSINIFLFTHFYFKYLWLTYQ